MRGASNAPELHAKKPWSTRRLREAYEEGAKAFGWAKRNPEPRSMREGHHLIGWGIAAGTYPVRRTAGEALVRIFANGRAEVASSGIDMGQGTYTSIPMLIAEELEVDLSQVRLEHAPPDEKRYGNPLLGGLQATGNSNAVRASWQPLRQAGRLDDVAEENGDLLALPLEGAPGGQDSLDQVSRRVRARRRARRCRRALGRSDQAVAAAPAEFTARALLLTAVRARDLDRHPAFFAERGVGRIVVAARFAPHWSLSARPDRSRKIMTYYSARLNRRSQGEGLAHRRVTSSTT